MNRIIIDNYVLIMSNVKLILIHLYQQFFILPRKQVRTTNELVYIYVLGVLNDYDVNLINLIDIMLVNS